MDISMTRSQMGLLLTVVGTVALAFSLRTKSQYTGEIAKVVKKAMRNNSRLFAPTETYIIRPLFWGGLFLVAVGALLQW
jgi:hypothetical protein